MSKKKQNEFESIDEYFETLKNFCNMLEECHSCNKFFPKIEIITHTKRFGKKIYYCNKCNPDFK
jgi:hypothetical protein